MSKKQNSEVVQLFSTNGSKTLSKLIITPVDGKGRFGNTYRHHFVSVLHEVMAHSTLLPRWLVMTSQWWNHGGIPLECFECQKYLICYVIMTSSANEKWSIFRYFGIFTPISHYLWLLKFQNLYHVTTVTTVNEVIEVIGEQWNTLLVPRSLT